MKKIDALDQLHHFCAYLIYGMQRVMQNENIIRLCFIRSEKYALFNLIKKQLQQSLLIGANICKKKSSKNYVVNILLSLRKNVFHVNCSRYASQHGHASVTIIESNPLWKGVRIMIETNCSEGTIYWPKVLFESLLKSPFCFLCTVFFSFRLFIKRSVVFGLHGYRAECW